MGGKPDIEAAVKAALLKCNSKIYIWYERSTVAHTNYTELLKLYNLKPREAIIQ